MVVVGSLCFRMAPVAVKSVLFEDIGIVVPFVLVHVRSAIARIEKRNPVDEYPIPARTDTGLCPGFRGWVQWDFKQPVLCLGCGLWIVCKWPRYIGRNPVGLDVGKAARILNAEHIGGEGVLNNDTASGQIVPSFHTGGIQKKGSDGRIGLT